MIQIPPHPAAAATCPAARMDGVNIKRPQIPRLAARLLLVLPGSRPQPTTRPGTSTAACPPARSRRTCATTPAGSAPPGRSAASAAACRKKTWCMIRLDILGAAGMRQGRGAQGERQQSAQRRRRRTCASRWTRSASHWPVSLDEVKSPLQGTGEMRNHPDANGGGQRRRRTLQGDKSRLRPGAFAPRARSCGGRRMSVAFAAAGTRARVADCRHAKDFAA